MTRALAFLAVLLLSIVARPPAARAGDPTSFWDLQPKSLRLLVASPQVMVTRTATGWDAYCRCPVILKPSEIPDVMKKAIVAVEDKRYFDHGGIDLLSLLSSLKGGLNRGGSTIPMQLLKNLVFHDLRRGDVLTVLERKGAEILHAGFFNDAVGKEDLLAAYLNQVEFGGREIVGLYRASRHYFHKEPKDLTLYEAALLAGMVQAPAHFNPVLERTRERARERALLVLKLMAEQGKITEKERALAEQAGITPGLLPDFRIQPQAFTEWVVQTWGERYVKPGETIRFFVTLDPRVQNLAEQQLDDLVGQGAVPRTYEAGAVMMAPNGRVQAMIGSLDWTQRQFNNAVKGSVQAGSTAKLPLLVAACEGGKTPESPVVDLPVSGAWPSNGRLGYRGQTTLMEAFASSRNAAAVRLAREIGLDRVAETSRRLGLDPGPATDPSFVLGSYSTNVLAMTAAYAAVANGGFEVRPSGVLAVVDGRGQVRADFLTTVRTRIIPQTCVGPTQEVLRAVVERGTGRAAMMKRWDAYGKTGTSSGNADAWFVGWSQERVLGIWMGRRRGEDGPVLSGAGAPATYFRRVSSAANAWDEQRRRLEDRRLVAAHPVHRGIDLDRLGGWLSGLGRSVLGPDAGPDQDAAIGHTPPSLPARTGPGARDARQGAAPPRHPQG